MMTLALLAITATALGAAALVIWAADRIMRDTRESEDDE